MKQAVAEVDTVLGLAPGVTKSSVSGATVKANPDFNDYKAMDYMGYVS
jgi:hypothetical protein